MGRKDLRPVSLLHPGLLHPCALSKICPLTLSLFQTLGPPAECSVSSLETPMLRLAMTLRQAAREDARWAAQRRAGERQFGLLMKGEREISEQLQSPAAPHTLASTGGEAAPDRLDGCQDTPRSGTQACVKVNANQLRRAHFLQREACQSARLVSSTVSANAGFIFAFYELEREFISLV